MFREIFPNFRINGQFVQVVNYGDIDEFNRIVSTHFPMKLWLRFLGFKQNIIGLYKIINFLDKDYSDFITPNEIEMSPSEFVLFVDNYGDYVTDYNDNYIAARFRVPMKDLCLLAPPYLELKCSEEAVEISLEKIPAYYNWSQDFFPLDPDLKTFRLYQYLKSLYPEIYYDGDNFWISDEILILYDDYVINNHIKLISEYDSIIIDPEILYDKLWSSIYTPPILEALGHNQALPSDLINLTGSYLLP